MPVAPARRSIAEELAAVITTKEEAQQRAAELAANTDRVVDADEAASILGIGIETLRVYRCNRIVRAVSPPHRPMQFRLGDLLAYRARRRTV